MKTYKKLNKFKAILLLSIFVGSMFYFVPTEPLSDLTLENQEPALYSTWGLGKIHNTADLKDRSPTTKQSVIDTDTWYLSESVLTEIEFNPQIMDYGSIVDEITGTYPYTFFSSGSFNTFSDDELEHDLTWVFDSPDTTYHAFASFKLYCGGTGTLSYEVFGRGTSSAPTSITTPEETSSDTIYSSWLNNQGYSHMIFIIYGTTTSISLELNVIIPATGVFLELFDISNTGSITDVEELLISMDVLSFTRNTIINTVRSEQKYTSSSTIMINKKIIPSVPHAKQITINLMEDETVTSVNPSASWSVSSNVLTISSPTELNYEVLTSRTCTNLLALRETSSDFLTDISFETAQYLNDWTVNYGTISLNTQTAFEGYYSLSIETSNNDYFTTSYGDACDFEEDVDEFDIKLNGLPTLDTIFVTDEYKLRLYTGLDGSDYGARRDNLNIDTNQYTLFSTEITMNAGVKADRVKITLHFNDASTQDHIEPIASGTTEEFDFDITADKTIEMIDIYYGDASWDIGGGDRIYVSYIEILETGAELTLTLPENDYYLSYSTYLETGSVTLTTDDRTLVNDGSIINRWINNFVFTHTDTITFTILFDDLDLTNFLDNFRIFQTSTTITTQGYSEYYFSSTLTAWDGYKNPFMPFADFEFELWDRTAQTIEDSYSTTTNEYGIASWTLERGLEQKEYELRAYSIDSYFGSEQTKVDVTNSVTDWVLVNEDAGTETKTCIDSSIVFEFRETGSINWEIQYNPSANFDISSSDIFYYTYRSNVTSRLAYKWLKTDSSNHISNQTDQSFTANIIYQFKDSFRHADYVETGTFDDTSVDIFYHRANLPTGWVKVEIFDFRFINAQKLYFTPSVPSQIDYAKTELNDAWDFSEGDLEDVSIHTNYDIVISSISTEDGSFILEYESAGTATSYVMTKITNLSPTLDLSYFDSFIIRAKSNSSATTHVFYLYHATHGVLSAVSGSAVGFSDSWEVIQTDVLQSLTLSDIYFVCRQQDILANSFKIEVDFIDIVHIDPFLEETNDYATDKLLDTWDFEEGDTEEWSRSGNVAWTGTVENGYYFIDITGTTSQYCKIQLGSGYSIDTDTYTHLVIRIQSYELFDLKFYAGDSYVGGQNDVFPSVWTTYIFDLSLDADWSGLITTGTNFRLDHDSGNFDGDEWYKIEYIYLIHQEELSYSTFQNSVLLESDTNDLQYNLYLDHNFIGTFPDLSLIPLVSTVGTHYLQVQPFRTDNCYITQNVYSYYYTVEADAFYLSVTNFYLSDDYANLFVISNFDCSYEITSGGSGSGSVDKEGTTISVTRITTPGTEVTLTVEFTYGSETVTFTTKYDNPVSAFYVESYTIDIQDENIEIIWSTTKSTIDSLVINEDGAEVDTSTTSPSSWTKSTVVGMHWVTLVFSAPSFQDVIFDFNYEIVSDVFQINIEDYHVGDLFIETYVTASENGNYQAYENNTVLGSQGTLIASGTSIQSDRNTTENVLIYYAIKFWNAEDIIWINTTYSNVEGDFFVIEYSVDIGETTITATWSTSLPDSDYLTIKEDGATKVTDDDDGSTDWSKSTVVGTHSVTLIFTADGGYASITYSFNYHIYAVADFRVDIGSFEVTEDHITTYASANYDGNYYVYEDNIQIDTDSFYGAGTNIETDKNTTAGATIAYAIKFVYESTEIWFNTTYDNPVTPFYLTDYRINYDTTITVTWDTTLPALDSLTIYEDGVLIEENNEDSTTTWTRSTVVGGHYVTLIFKAEGYDDIVHTFTYIIYPPVAFSVDIESFYVSDDYLNIYATANFDYTYAVYENGTPKGSGNGMAIGTTIISPKNNAAGLYNFTVVFTYNSETITFMTWYSNLIPPNHPLNDLWRMESQGFYNISVHSNLEFFWIDIYHDDSLIIDDSTASKFSIEKGLRVGWHNITLLYIYNCSTDDTGYPVTEYNVTLTYEFWYETTFFYDVKIRYIEDVIGLAISEINVNDFKTYIDGELIQHGDIDDVAEYSNYSYISNYDIRIKNTAPLHTLVINDLLGSVILSTTIDISTFVEKILILPVYRLGVINYDNETHKFGVQPLRDVNKPWHLSPEIPQGVFLQFWFCDVDYLFRIYSATTYYDDDGNILSRLWDTWVDLPPGRLPRVFEIPLSYDGDITPPASWWENNKSWVISCAVIAGFLIAIAILILVRKINKKELIK